MRSNLDNKGDNGFNNPDHHGTGKERLDAFYAGFEVEDDDVNVAYAKGEEYIKKHPPSDRPPVDPDAKKEYFAKNLGVHYRLIKVPDGTFTLQISRSRRRFARGPRWNRTR